MVAEGNHETKWAGWVSLAPAGPGPRPPLGERTEVMCIVQTRTAPTQRKPRPKPARSIRWAERPTADHPAGLVRITVGKEVAFYDVTEVDCHFDGCRAF